MAENDTGEKPEAETGEIAAEAQATSAKTARRTLVERIGWWTGDRRLANGGRERGKNETKSLGSSAFKATKKTLFGMKTIGQ